MKASREEAAANRQRIVEVAGRLFRENGFDGIGVADLMKGAGMTHGGFYGHFDSKDDLAAEACGRALAQAAEKWTSLVEESNEKAFAALVDYYLSEERILSLGKGCMLSTLGSDAARQGRPLRRVFRDGLNTLVSILAGTITARSKAERRRKSLAAMSQMVGAVVLARFVGEPELAHEILNTAAADLKARAG